MDSITTRPYVYTPLPTPDSFRLIELLPGLPDSPLQCKLILARRDAGAPEYEALSYVWGAPVFAYQLEEVSSSATVHITDNLYHALQALRRKDRSRWLWVDAVCIAQGNVQEKSHQVRQMSLIYRKARRVVVWLGEDSKKGAFKQLVGLSRSRWCEPRRYNRNASRLRRVAYKIDTQDASEQHCNLRDVEKFLGRSWFERVWVVQEYVLAKHVTFYVGRACMSNEALWDAIAILIRNLDEFHRRWLSPNTTPNIYQANWLMTFRKAHKVQEGEKHKTFLTPSEYINMAEFLYLFERRQCKDDRDRFYALLGLLYGNVGIYPDYTLDIYQVRMDVTKKTLLAGDLSILDYVEPFTTMVQSASRPSFLVQIPFASLPTFKRPREIEMGTSASRLNHAAKFCVPRICDTGKSTIGIHGVCVDRVAEMIFLVRKADRPGIYVVTGDEEYLDRSESYPGRRLVSARNMLGIYRYISSYRSRQFKLSTAEHDAMKSGFWRIINANRTATTMRELRLDDFERSLLGCDLSRNAFTPRVFFMTELGFFGICSKWTRKGDHVVFFGGRPKPYTLRPVEGEDGQRQWKLVGDCFIEDCMEGHYFEPKTYDTCGKEYDKDAERLSDERFTGRTRKLYEEQFVLC